MKVLGITGAATGLMLASTMAMAQPKQFTPPEVEIETDASIPYKTAMDRYGKAWRTCMADPTATRNADTFVACLNKNGGKGIRFKKK